MTKKSILGKSTILLATTMAGGLGYSSLVNADQSLFGAEDLQRP